MQIKKLVSMGSRTGRQYQRYNIQGCRQVVGCIPYRFRKTNSPNGTPIEELEVLLVSSQKSSRMMFPKGGWENDESMEEAALRETIEEAGVDGIVGRILGTWSFESSSQGKFNEGHMFPLLVTEELDIWPEKDARQRIWMSINEASIVCAHSWMIKALKLLVPQLVHLQEKDETRAPCPLEFLSQQKEECQTPCSLEFLSQLKEEYLTPCGLEFLRTESPRIDIVAHGAEEEVDCFLVK